MKTSSGCWCLLVSALFGWGVHAQKINQPEAAGDSVSFVGAEATTYFRAVYGHYLAVIPNDVPGYNVDCGLSISNVCAAPEAVSPLITGSGGPTAGRIALYLYNRDGSLTVFSPDSDQVGSGLNEDGTLSAGQTWTVRLAEVLSHAWGVDESEVEFSGYAWVLSGFDCLAGTYNNTIFGLGFTQAFEFLPGMGHGGFFGGVMVPNP